MRLTCRAVRPTRPAIVTAGMPVPRIATISASRRLLSRAVEWQAVARETRLWAARYDDDSASRLLLDELAHYLREEGLMDEEAIRPAHVFVLSALQETHRTVARLLELADEYVTKTWGPKKRFGALGGTKAELRAGILVV
jgi:hypothetical protein